MLKRTPELGLACACLVRGKQFATEGATSPVETLKRVVGLAVSAQYSLDFGVVCHAYTLTRKGILAPATKEHALALETGYLGGAGVTADRPGHE